MRREVDQYDRAIFSDREVPSPWDPDSRFAQWRGKTCGPWTVITVPERSHHVYCRDGWTNNDAWWFVCGRCHPTAVDQPATYNHQGDPDPITCTCPSPQPGPTDIPRSEGGSYRGSCGVCRRLIAPGGEGA